MTSRDGCADALGDAEQFCFASNPESGLAIAHPLGLVFQLDDLLSSCRDLLETPAIYEPLLAVAARGTVNTPDDIRATIERPIPAGAHPEPGHVWRDDLRNMVLRGALWKALNTVRVWRHERIQVGGPGYVVNAEVKSLGTGDAAEVVFYGTSCTPTDLYGVDLGHIDGTTRYLLIAAHEYGHVIDHLSGGLATYGHSDPEAERRATMLGSFVAECWLHGLGSMLQQPAQSLIQGYGAVLRDEHKRACFIEQWRRAERSIATLRGTWADAGIRVPESMQNRTGCVSYLSADAGG
jgi:hypothetical protein